MALSYLDKARDIFSWLSFATEFCNIQVIDFIQVGKWLQKGSILQPNSNPCHNPLIPHQSTWAREALGFQGLRKMVVRKNLLWDLFRWAGVGMIRRSDELFDHTLWFSELPACPLYLVLAKGRSWIARERRSVNASLEVLLRPRRFLISYHCVFNNARHTKCRFYWIGEHLGMVLSIDFSRCDCAAKNCAGSLKNGLIALIQFITKIYDSLLWWIFID